MVEKLLVDKIESIETKLLQGLLEQYEWEIINGLRVSSDILFLVRKELERRNEY